MQRNDQWVGGKMKNEIKNSHSKPANEKAEEFSEKFYNCIAVSDMKMFILRSAWINNSQTSFCLK